VHEYDKKPKKQTNKNKRAQQHEMAADLSDRVFDHAHPFDDPFDGQQIITLKSTFHRSYF
jgi:hypothetical protein